MENIYTKPTYYSQHNDLQYNFSIKTLTLIELFSTIRLLDIGCGDGLITNEIARITQNGCIIGTDISFEMINFASKAYQSQKNLRFLQMNACDNIFFEQFDAITSFNCLHWINDTSSVFKGIYNALINNGKMLILLSNQKSIYHFLLDKLSASKKWRSYFKNFNNPRQFLSKDIYAQHINNAGLNIVEIFEKPMLFEFQSKEELKHFLLSANAHVKALPEKEADEFANEFTELYCLNASIMNNKIPIEFPSLQIIGQKS